MKEQSGRDPLIYGSGELVNTLHPHGLIDEYRLMVFLVTLGVGKHLFQIGTDKRDLKLSDAKVTSTGVALLTYQTESERSREG